MSTNPPPPGPDLHLAHGCAWLVRTLPADVPDVGSLVLLADRPHGTEVAAVAQRLSDGTWVLPTHEVPPDAHGVRLAVRDGRERDQIAWAVPRGVLGMVLRVDLIRG